MKKTTHKSGRSALIHKYKHSYEAVADALAGATRAELDARPGPGKWSAREVVHHLADSEMMSAMRLRLLLAQDRPIIFGYEQDDFAKKLNYQNRPIEAALAAFRFARETTAEILEQMTESDWTREGWHSENGRYTPDRWLQIYSQHALDHADQIKRARASARKRKQSLSRK